MGKGKTFADKVAKANVQHGKKCPKCGDILQPLLFVKSEPSKHKSIRFSHRRVQVCKCKEKEIYG